MARKRTVEVTSRIPEVMAAVEGATNRWADETARRLKAETQHQMDVLIYDTPPSPNYQRTGNLRRSVETADAGKGKVLVTANIEYASYVHEGTRHMGPRPFLDNAVKAIRADMKVTLRERIAGVLRRVK